MRMDSEFLCSLGLNFWVQRWSGTCLPCWGGLFGEGGKKNSVRDRNMPEYSCFAL